MHKGINVLIAILAGVAAPCTIQAMDAENAVKTVLSNNPRLKAIEESHDAQRRMLGVEGRITSQPEVEFEHLWGKDGSTKWNVGVTQGFDWPGVYAKRKAGAQAQIDAFQYLYDSEALSVAMEVRLCVARMVYVNRQLEMMNEVSANLKKLQALVATGYEKGQLNILDVKKLNFEVYSIETKLADLKQEEGELQAQLAALNGGAPVAVDAAAYSLQPIRDKEYYLNAAVENNPDVKAANQKAEASRASAKVARANRLPGFSLGYRHAFEEQTHFNGFAVGVTIPVFTTSAAVSAADMEARGFNFEAVTAASSARTAISARYDDALRRSAALKDMAAVALDENYPRLLLMAYEGGQINVITYLQEINFFISARADYLSSEYNYVVDLTELNRFSLGIDG